MEVDRGRQVVRELRRGRRVAPRVLAVDRATFVPVQAGPLAGDHDVVRVRVGAGARLTIEPVAATAALPGAALTRLELDLEVGDGGWLVFEDAPLVVAEGADVVRSVSVTLGVGAVFKLRDVVILGRAGEGPGRLESVLRVSGPDGVLLHDALHVDPATWAADGSVALAPGHRVVGTVALFGAETAARAAASDGAVAGADAAERAGPAAKCGAALEYGGTLFRVSAVSAADVEAQLPAVR